MIKQITYDSIGNPLTYDGWTFTWEQGKNLANIKNSIYDISFNCNSSGIRTQKIVNGLTTKYNLVGDRVTQETNGTDTIYYSYNSMENLVSMNLNGVEYYYVRNAQGDIIGLLNGAGQQVVSYTYDSWGKPFVTKAEQGDANDTNKDGITGSLANLVMVKNPYRNRGYRYDIYRDWAVNCGLT